MTIQPEDGSATPNAQQTTQNAGPSGPTVNVNIDQKSYLIIMHASVAAAFVLGPLCFMVPLVMWLMKKDQSPEIDAHGKAAINFQISIAIYWLVGAVLTFVIVGIFVLIAVYILAIVGAVKGAIDASNGKLYKYPLSLRLIV